MSSASHLHTPVYILLSSLFFTDMCISSTIIPKMLVNSQAQNQSISLIGCFSHLTFILMFSYLENFLHAVIAYDYYMAICHPLRCTVIMTSASVSCLFCSVPYLALEVLRSTDLWCFGCTFAHIWKSATTVNLLSTSILPVLMLLLRAS